MNHEKSFDNTEKGNFTLTEHILDVDDQAAKLDGVANKDLR